MELLNVKASRNTVVADLDAMGLKPGKGKRGRPPENVIRVNSSKFHIQREKLSSSGFAFVSLLLLTLLYRQTAVVF